MGNSLNSVVFHPPKPTYSGGDPHLHMLPTKCGHLIAAFYIRHRYVVACNSCMLFRRSRFTILYSHGNAEDIGHVFHALMDRVANWDADLFIYDYSGYGVSEGKPSERNLYMDVEAAYDYLTQALGVDPNTVVAYGRSIGSGPAVHIALHRPVLGLILQSPVASVYRVRFHRLPFSMPGDIFRNIDKVQNLNVPTLILHGTEDETVPLVASQQMALKISEVYCRWIKGASHNDMDGKYVIYVEQALQEFFARIMQQHPANVMRKGVWISRGKQGTIHHNAAQAITT
ncbi:Abhydrolase domain-containing protein [Babesia bigemina]|uniref:Abhydrolase domain-containing protein n=1 Tax=Babesia bigemina TaxID=5866 RepID=A0A061D7S7_BABBI|nr:Abhydrolase domain-containing protein [Babesia bigemina]CDR96047.1 Abhydrolase domain-containing protein [Babesia bigemina]|eukprot:XP_012768233.1 Abhydrolase domain-containing protein [Babesia bigemina]